MVNSLAVFSFPTDMYLFVRLLLRSHVRPPHSYRLPLVRSSQVVSTSAGCFASGAGCGGLDATTPTTKFTSVYLVGGAVLLGVELCE